MHLKAPNLQARENFNLMRVVMAVGHVRLYEFVDDFFLAFRAFLHVFVSAEGVWMFGAFICMSRSMLR